MKNLEKEILRIIEKYLLFARYFLFSMKRFFHSLFEFSFQGLILILPFMTIISVFTSEKLWLHGFSFLKELLVLSMGIGLLSAVYKKRISLHWNRYDFLIGLYIITLIGITVFTTGFMGMIYGGRYDFSFLIAFLLMVHGYPLLKHPLSYYLRLFLISSGIALFAGMSLKWPFSEDFLLYLGFSGNPSNWQFGWAVPIFHGVDGANVRRLQGIFDGPNTMGAYILIYMGILAYYFRNKKNWYFVIGCVLCVGVLGLYYTYSRSALLGLVGGVGITVLSLLPILWKKYKLQMSVFFSVILIGIMTVLFLFSDSIRAIFDRQWSTKWHAERMLVGYHRFIDHPFWQWLGSAGPAYRYVANLETIKREEIEKLDTYYIPESWYIQQMVEWGIFGTIFFLLIMICIFWSLLSISPVIGGMFTSILIMNFFLHTFESSLVSLSLFLLAGLFIGADISRKYAKK